jgi:predicted DNA-binding WGR domain protein
MALRMTRVDPARNMARWYEIDVQPTLFGDYTVARHWGRIGAVGQSKTFWFDDEASADQMAKSVCTAKARRGYIDTRSEACRNS